MNESLPSKKSQDIRVRSVSENDAEILLNWRNLPEVRKWSHSTELIDLKSHQEWFKKRLSDKSSRDVIFIVENGKTPVGMVRFDEIQTEEFEISVLVDPKYQKQGIAELAINLALEHVLQIIENIKIFASVHYENTASRKLFRKLGFEMISENGNFQKLCRIYELKNLK